MQLKSGSAASKGGGASTIGIPVGDWERDRANTVQLSICLFSQCPLHLCGSLRQAAPRLR
ncbi:MAG: hypothetical protein V7K39_00780 [Nostoc sp.]